MNDQLPHLKCPVCGKPLKLMERTLRCEQNHCFDRAKQGYFNLLLNQDKSSKNPGDTIEMVQARQRFLALGHYRAIVDACISQISHHAKSHQVPTITYTDIACGEGYYTQQFHNFLARDMSLECALTGIDISIPAIRTAAKRVKEAAWLVGNAFRLPVSDHSQSLVTHMFSRPCMSEARRIIMNDGLLLDVSAGQNHLIELRKHLYPDVKIKKRVEKTPISNEDFELLEDQRVSYTFTLNSKDAILDLITMTPHVWRAQRSEIERTAELRSLSLSCDVYVASYKPKNHINGN
ncbi:hypothetical protein A3715_09150 [Oleiphilus sp. HI0009]|uniref:putative RNA methyltransferase n=1 Tax=unclassified Oleiphilus TaxID=2631174 RepID=UPI0007C3B12A|nr:MULTISPECIES: methyltransferase domain-containing protein [unclassified Oleiphilus]KZX78980.1 hypothetical protein A3715_09150 [Oleiphilus sp. HI0009]MCH2159425.1 methyltransferase domain-containing protein [Oleiphilaceae bacterium]KZY66004.1 hypothetical protein A3738_00665 [Oleiphilus sp. HI0066]KZY67665.1 hypothetical protein A3739_01755 [Oleiphilus sp. HI0067]KZY70772.1 hypothetical protein A3739_17485 [Oleiphilus sp. HI0067]